MTKIHTVFDYFCRNNARNFKHSECGGGDLNFLGLHIPAIVDTLRTDVEDLYWSGRSATHWHVDSSIPNPLNEDYFEYIDLLESIKRCDGHYQMAEIGAGYGRWMLNAVHAIRRCSSNIIPSYFVLGFEADISRGESLKKLMAKNDIVNYELVQKIVSNHPATLLQDLPFIVHNSDAGSFGGAIIDNERDVKSGRPPVESESWMKVERLPTCRLPDAALKYGVFDFMNFDVQNAEIEVIPDAIDYLNDYVKLVHVGTHSTLADEIVSETFLNAQWRPRWQFKWKSTVDTPLGKVSFRDGIQSFENPKFLS